MPGMTARLSCLSMALLFAGPVLAQNKGQATSSQDKSRAIDESVPDDIVVEGYTARQKLPTVAQAPAAVRAVRLRRLYEYSERIADCAARSRLSDLSRLRAVVDGDFNSVTQVLAQDKLKRIYITCSESPWLASITSPDGGPPAAGSVRGSGMVQGGTLSVEAAPLGHSIYDRGAFMIAAMKTYTPNLKLNKQVTNDPVVQERFNRREEPRNRFRDPVDYRYFEVAVCMVRLEPELAVRLTMSGNAAKIDGVQATLINRARVCVGNAPKVDVDPTQFRIYIADAVYRWAVAARGTDSLIPASKEDWAANTARPVNAAK